MIILRNKSSPKEEEKSEKTSENKKKVAKNLTAGATVGAILAAPKAAANGLIRFGEKLAEKEPNLLRAALKDSKKEKAVQLVEDAVNGKAYIKGATPENLEIARKALPKMKERVAFDKKATEKFAKKVVSAAKKAGGKKALKTLGTGAALGVGAASILTALDNKNKSKKSKKK